MESFPSIITSSRPIVICAQSQSMSTLFFKQILLTTSMS